MKTKRNILLTFDYEPYLGELTGSFEKNIIEPTQELQKLLSANKAKAVFFADTLCLITLRKHPELSSIYNSILSQLKNLHQEGHYIFPHIHPHWIDAEYLPEKKQFSLKNLSKYSLASLTITEVQNLFKDSINLLKENGINYPEWGYRAGGWCIQPFNRYKDVFLSENIKYEFSVLPGYKNEHKDQYFDFTNVLHKEPYFFSEKIEEEKKDGAFVEFPISTISLSAITRVTDRLIRKYLWKKGDRGWGNGKSAQTAALQSHLIHTEMISLDILNSGKLASYKTYLKRNNYMHWISHPKMFTRNGLKCFDYFLKHANKNYSAIYDFKKMVPEK